MMAPMVEAFRSAAVKFLKMGRLTFDGGNGSFKDFLEPKNDQYQEQYAGNVWAYRGISAIATAASSVPLQVVTGQGKKLSVLDGHQFVELIENPNPFMTRQDLIEFLFIFLESCGDGYWLLDDLSGSGRPVGAPLALDKVKEIWPMFSHEVRIKGDKDSFIGGYEYRPTGATKGLPLSVAEVFHVRYPNPLAMLSGQGALKPVIGDIVGDFYAQTFEKFIMRNLSTNMIFLKTSNTFAPDQKEEYKRALANVFKGVRLGFMENGLDFATPQLAPADLPFLEMDKRRERRILGALGVPPIMAGSQDAKYDNAEQQMAFFWRNTMIPKFSRVQAMLTKKLRALTNDEHLSVRFDLSVVKAMQDDYAAEAEIAKAWHGMGVPLNALIQVFAPEGIEEVDGGEVGLVPAGLIPILDVIDPDPPEPEGTPEDAPPPKPGEAPAPEPEDEEPEEKSVKGDRAMDDAHWKRFAVTTEPGYRRLRAEVRRFFKAQKAAILARLEENFKAALIPETRAPRVELILLDEQVEGAKLARKAAPILAALYAKMGKQLIADVGASIAFNVDSPLAVKFIQSHVPRFSFEVNKTTRARLKALLEQKFGEGVTQKELTEAIVKEFGFAEKYRAARIARTESGIAANSGIHDGMIQAGVKLKRWISSRDGKVRDSHQEKNLIEVEVPINDYFQVGTPETGYTAMRYPGDPDAPVGEVANCRCVARAARFKE